MRSLEEQNGLPIAGSNAFKAPVLARSVGKPAFDQIEKVYAKIFGDSSGKVENWATAFAVLGLRKTVSALWTKDPHHGHMKDAETKKNRATAITKVHAFLHAHYAALEFVAVKRALALSEISTSEEEKVKNWRKGSPDHIADTWTAPHLFFPHRILPAGTNCWKEQKTLTVPSEECLVLQWGDGDYHNTLPVLRVSLLRGVKAVTATMLYNTLLNSKALVKSSPKSCDPDADVDSSLYYPRKNAFHKLPPHFLSVSVEAVSFGSELFVIDDKEEGKPSYTFSKENDVVQKRISPHKANAKQFPKDKEHSQKLTGVRQRFLQLKDFGQSPQGKGAGNMVNEWTARFSPAQLGTFLASQAAKDGGNPAWELWEEHPVVQAWHLYGMFLSDARDTWWTPREKAPAGLHRPNVALEVASIDKTQNKVSISHALVGDLQRVGG